MYTQTFISSVIQSAKDNDNFEQLRTQIPLGVDMAGQVVTAQKYSGALAWRHICVTGGRRMDCICNLLITLSCFYEKDEVNFIILSPRLKYAELLGAQNMNVIVPYVRSKNDLQDLKVGLRDLLYMHMQSKGLPKLFLVLDSLEDLPDCDAQELKEYGDLLRLVMKVPNVQVISGVNLMKSMFSGCPGAFVGIGNCLVTTREDGKADVTYVGDDTNLSLPVLIDFPCQPSVKEMVQILNGVSMEEETAAQEDIFAQERAAAECENPFVATATVTASQTEEEPLIASVQEENLANVAAETEAAPMQSTEKKTQPIEQKPSLSNRWYIESEDEFGD